MSASFSDKDVDVDIVLMYNNEIAYSISPKVNVVYFDADLLSCSKRISYMILRRYFKKQKQKYGKIVVIPFLDTCLKRVLLSVAGLGIPVIACERNDPYQKGRGFFARTKANIPYILASHCIFQTSGAAAYYTNGVQKKSTVIMNPLAMSEDIKWKGRISKRIVSIGRLTPQKNQMMLFEAFHDVHREYPEYILEIYGEGSMREILQAKINELHLGESVFLRGYSSDVPQVLQDSYLFVLSSDYEGMSNALIEALAVGMPVITTDHPCGGAKMLVRDGVNGILVPIGNSRFMANAMKRLIEDENLALQIGKNAYRIRAKLSAEHIAAQWLKVIRSL